MQSSPTKLDTEVSANEILEWNTPQFHNSNRRFTKKLTSHAERKAKRKRARASRKANRR